MRTLRVAAVLLCIHIVVFVRAGLAQGAPVSDGTLPSQRITHTQGSAQVVPDYVTYRFFFTHLANLGQLADSLEKAGKDGSKWRTHDQHAAGLSDAEGQILTQVAQDCNQSLKNEDTKIQSSITGFHNQFPNGQFVSVSAPPELAQFENEKIQAINTHIEQLKSQLGQDSFNKLDVYVKNTFKPAIITLPAAAASARPTGKSTGGAQ
jgi:hypothetical protein